MKEISRVYEKLPKWLQCARSLVPDFVMSDPKSAPVWEITGLLLYGCSQLHRFYVKMCNRLFSENLYTCSAIFTAEDEQQRTE